jgi:hypothetical protein
MSCDDAVRLRQGGDYAEMLCAKLTPNMCIQQWREWVSPDIDYIPACPDLPIPPDDDLVELAVPEANSPEWKEQA